MSKVGDRYSKMAAAGSGVSDDTVLSGFQAIEC